MMSTEWRNITGMLAVCILAFLLPPPAKAQTTKDTTKADIRSIAYFLPARQEPWKYQHALSMSHFFLPSDWTNLAINAPQFNYHARYSLPAGFQADAMISTLFVSNQFRLGPRWTWSKGNFHLGLAYHYAYNLGFLNDFGFEVTVTSWNHIPSIAVGYSWEKSTLTLNVGREYLGNLTYTTGDNVMHMDEFKLNGSHVGLTLEQRLWNNRILSFAFQMNHVNFIMLAWPAYPVNNKTYFVPQINIGLVF